MARRGLEATSAMDSFLGSLVGALKDPESNSFQVHQDLDASAILAFIQTLMQDLKTSADVFAKLHPNHILAKRDSVLLAFFVTCASALRASL